MNTGRLLLSVLMGVLLAACGTPPDPTPSTTARPTSTATAASPSSTPDATRSPSETVEATGTPQQTVPPVAFDPPAIELELVVGGLDAPTNVAPLPDGRLLVNERPGRVVAIDPATGASSTALDITDRVLGQGEQGLLGLVLHPDWPDRTEAFVHYTDRERRTVLSSFTISSTDPFVIEPASEEVLLRVEQPFDNHNGGQLAIGPDRMLWLGLGDGGAGGDPMGNGQDRDTLLGAILRFDLSQPGSLRTPDDAPFADGGGAPEVHLYGLRNPWRFSFDRRTGRLWIADVGQNAFEEVNRIDPVDDAGGNLGWNVMEASHCFGDADCSSDGLIGPVTEYGRDAGCSITGGYVYRGEAIDGLAGWYLFGDYCAGTVFGIPSDVAELTPPRTLLTTDAQISAFGEDAGGELYVADLRGALYRIVRGD